MDEHDVRVALNVDTAWKTFDETEGAYKRAVALLEGDNPISFLRGVEPANRWALVPSTIAKRVMFDIAFQEAIHQHER